MKRWFMVLAGVAMLATTGCIEEVQEKAADPAGNDSPVVESGEHGGWQTDFEAAKAQAKAEGKYILMDFSGSDWCGWCVKLDKEVFAKPAFQEYASQNLVLVLADFPNDKSNQSAALQAQNAKLAEAFSVTGFPTVFVLSPEGEMIAKTGYQAGGPVAYVDHVKKLIADAK